MKICTCESCHYTFRYPILPPSCPDCGQKKIRLANKAETKDYHRLQAILAEEIRMGLYAATGQPPMEKNDIDTTIGYMPMPTDFPYKSIFLKGRPRHEKYDDFWRRHPPMDPVHRAKIFSPFDALAGFGDCIASKEIQYCRRRDLSEGEREELDRKLAVLQRLTCNGKEARKNRPQITVQYFSPCTDACNSAYGTGGTYETQTGICLKIDPVSKTVKLDETIISIEDISDISGDLFEATDNDIP